LKRLEGWLLAVDIGDLKAVQHWLLGAGWWLPSTAAALPMVERV